MVTPSPSHKPRPPVDDEIPVQVLETPEHLQHDALDLQKARRSAFGTMCLTRAWEAPHQSPPPPATPAHASNLGLREGCWHVLQKAGQVLLTVAHHQEDAKARGRKRMPPPTSPQVSQGTLLGSRKGSREGAGQGLMLGQQADRPLTSPGGSPQPPPSAPQCWDGGGEANLIGAVWFLLYLNPHEH